MKTIFTVSTENDGLQNACFTNIKALHEFLIGDLEMGKSHIYVLCPDMSSKKFEYGYQKLIYSIRNAQKNNRFCVANIESDFLGSVSINELGILSK